jgi:hypothetical protein
VTKLLAVALKNDPEAAMTTPKTTKDGVLAKKTVNEPAKRRRQLN